MLYAISWFLGLALLTIWSAGVWGVHSIVVWSLTGVGALAGQSPQLDRLPIPGWVGLWIPGEVILAFKASVAAVLPWVESSLSTLPSLAGWVAPVAWFIWAIGFLLLAIGAIALHVVISMTRRRAAP